MTNEFYLPFSIFREGYNNLQLSVFYADATSPTTYTNLSYFLHLEELKQVEAFRSDSRKASYLLGRYCAKMALARLHQDVKLSDIYIQAGVFTQPVVKSPLISNTRVSISHSENAAIAIAFQEEHPMAIDIETVKGDHSEMILSLLSDNERQFLTPASNMDQNILLTAIWSAKECLGKVLGTGLTTGLDIFEIKTLKLIRNSFIDFTFKHFIQYKATCFMCKEKVTTILSPQKTRLLYMDDHLKYDEIRV